MARIAIVTDSASNLPREIVASCDITVVPVYLHWNGRVYRDGIDITPKEVYRRLRAKAGLPKTAAPSVGDFLQNYLRLGREADGILSIHLPEKLSGVIAAARVAGDLAGEVVPVQVIDAGSVAMGVGFVALAAARAAKRGARFEQVQRAAQAVRDRVRVFAMLDTLEYLLRGGRIGRAEALLGIALKIKPILYLRDGSVDVLAKPRTLNRGFRLMLEEMEKEVDGNPVHVAVLHADAPVEARILREQVGRRFHCVETLTCPFSPVMGAHTGPGVLGLAFYTEIGAAP